MNAKSQHLVCGTLIRTDGTVIQKYAFINHGEVYTCEEPIYLDTKAEAEEVMKALSHHTWYKFAYGNWHIAVVPAPVQPETKVVATPERTPRQWYRIARRVWGCYQDALGGGILESDTEEVWTTWAAWMTIPKPYRVAARATARDSA